MRTLRMCVGMMALLLVGAVSIAEAEPIVLGVLGTSSSTEATVVPTGGGTFDLTFPSATWTQTFELGPNNIGLSRETPLLFAGATIEDVELNGGDVPLEVPSLVTFTTPLGNFQFDSLLAILFEVEPNPFTDTPFGVLAVGTLSGGGFDSTLTLMFSLFDEDGTYGEAGFSLATASFLDATAIPEPPGLLLAGLALGALVWHHRRAHG